MSNLAFTDEADGYYEFAEDAPPSWYAHLTPVSRIVPPAPPPPQSVTRFQARAALHLAGLLEQVETLMNDPASDPLARLAWTDAQEFRRQSPTVLGMAALLGLTAEQLDQLFIAAAEIEA